MSDKQNKASFIQTLSAVLWSFFGVRKSESHLNDMQNLNPFHVIIVGFLAAAVFVICLLALVNYVVGSI
jgi:hypothetical protein